MCLKLTGRDGEKILVDANDISYVTVSYAEDNAVLIFFKTNNRYVTVIEPIEDIMESMGYKLEEPVVETACDTAKPAIPEAQ